MFIKVLNSKKNEENELNPDSKPSLTKHVAFLTESTGLKIYYWKLNE